MPRSLFLPKMNYQHLHPTSYFFSLFWFFGWKNTANTKIEWKAYFFRCDWMNIFLFMGFSPKLSLIENRSCNGEQTFSTVMDPLIFIFSHSQMKWKTLWKNYYFSSLAFNFFGLSVLFIWRSVMLKWWW